MKDMKIRQGGRLSFEVIRADSEAISATVIFSSDEYSFSDTIAYDEDGKAFFEFGSPDTDTVGLYDYQVNENFSEGSPDIYPSADDCEGDCEFPTLEICQSLPEGS
jgi:hypothetical protein